MAGNVRELANIVERISIISPGGEIAGDYVSAILDPPDARPFAIESAAAKDSAKPSEGLNDTLDAIERRMIQNALTEANGNVAEAARTLKTDRANLYRRMKRLEIE